MPSTESHAKKHTKLRVLFGIFFVTAGFLHFVIPGIYLRIMPPYLPWHLPLVYLSGAAEIFGGLGLQVERTRRTAAWGLALLLIAVMPANVYMATAHLPAPGILGASWAKWLRLPLQIPLIYWAWVYTRR